MNHRESQRTLTVLANANALSEAIIRQVIGNDVADTLEGSPITRASIYNMTQTEAQASLAQHIRSA